MSHSREKRLQNLELALKAIVAELGDRAFDQLLCDPRDAKFKEVFPTSWIELEERFLVTSSPTPVSIRYQLTAAGCWKE